MKFVLTSGLFRSAILYFSFRFDFDCFSSYIIKMNINSIRLSDKAILNVAKAKLQKKIIQKIWDLKQTEMGNH